MITPPNQEPMIGAFPFYSGKAEQQQTQHGGRCIAYLFALHVSEELQAWPEAHQRTREWVSQLARPCPGVVPAAAHSEAAVRGCHLMCPRCSLPACSARCSRRASAADTTG